MKFLTSSTRAQLEIGIEISKDVNDLQSFVNIMNSSFSRDKEWIEYHAESLAESIISEEIDIEALREADIEQKAFRLWRDGYYEKAIIKLEKYCQETAVLDKQSKGWLLQLAGRIAYHWGNKEKAQQLQQNAYASNLRLLRPQIVPPYIPLLRPSKQAVSIFDRISGFLPRRGFISEFDENISNLIPQASSNQFEESLENLGGMLGFSSERPEKTYGVGPDVLWLLNGKIGLVIEAKSRKNEKNPLTKEEHGQLLVAIQWFKEKYPDYKYIGVSIHPNKTATKNAIAQEIKALTYDKLNELISNARGLFIEICESIREEHEIIDLCGKLLAKYNLYPEGLIKKYLLTFELQKP